MLSLAESWIRSTLLSGGLVGEFELDPPGRRGWADQTSGVQPVKGLSDFIAIGARKGCELVVIDDCCDAVGCVFDVVRQLQGDQFFDRGDVGELVGREHFGNSQRFLLLEGL